MHRLIHTNCLDKCYQHYYGNGYDCRGNILLFTCYNGIDSKCNTSKSIHRILIFISTHLQLQKKLKRIVNSTKHLAYRLCHSLYILFIYFVNRGLPNPIAASLRPRKTCMTPLRLSTEFSHAFKNVHYII